MHDDLDKEYRAWELLRWSTPAALADFDEALADAGFYSSVQQKRSDQALDAWEQENIRPTTELDAFRELVSLGVFHRAGLLLASEVQNVPLQQKRSMSISDNSNLSPWHQAMWKLKEHAQVCVTTYPEAEWMAAMRNQAACLDLSFDVKDTDLECLISNAQAASNPDYAWLPGQQVSSDEPEWILDGLIHKGYFHALYAPAKLGKTTLVLDFVFHLFSKQVQSFLNLKLNSFKNYTLYLIGPDMCVELWAKLLGTAGLLANDGTLGPGVKYVSPERNVDSLSDAHLDKYSDMAIKAKANGEEPIFVFDCYSTMATNTPGINASEVSDLYYKPLRKLKNAMSATGATTILLHHSSKSSRKNGAVDAAAGNSSFSRVPDVLIKLDWLVPNQDFDDDADKRIVLNATGRIDPKGLLIARSPEGHFENLGNLSDAKRTAYLAETECSLMGDYARANDFIGELAACGRGCTITALVNQMGANWNRHKARKVMDSLKRKSLVTVAGQEAQCRRQARLRLHALVLHLGA